MTRCQSNKGNGRKCSCQAKNRNPSKSFSPELYEYNDQDNKNYVHSTPIPFIYKIKEIWTFRNKKKKSLEYVTEIRKKITNYDILEIIKILKLHPYLEDLTLSKGKVSNDVFQELINTIQSTNITNSLGFAHMELNNEQATMISRLTKVKHIYVAHNNIGDAGAVELAKNKHFLSVNLSHNKVGDAGAVELAKNKHFREVYLSGNKVGDIGAEAFAKNNTIKFLDLGDNVKDNGIIALASNTTLKDLNVTGKFTKQAAKSFLQNKTLYQLGLYSSKYDEWSPFDDIEEHIREQGYKLDQVKLRGKEKFQKAQKQRKVLSEMSDVTYQPGGAGWARTMGELTADIGSPPKTMDKCLNMSYIDPDGLTVLYDKKQLYNFARGMGLIPDKSMTKNELCRLITTGIKMGKEAPF